MPGDVPGELRGSCKKQVKAGQRDKHERKRGERESSAGSDLEIRGGGGGGSPKTFFWPLGP